METGNPMQVHVDTYANLRQYSPAGRGSFDLTLNSDATVSSIIDALNIPCAVKIVILVNGRRAAGTPGLKPLTKLPCFHR